MIHSYTVHYVAINSQVCFHRWLFADSVKLYWCITGPVEPLVNTNQNWWGAKLLPMSVSVYPVDCVHLCYLLTTQYHCLCSNGRENSPSTCPPTLLPPTYPLIHNTCDTTGIVNKLSQKVDSSLSKNQGLIS